MKKIEEKIINDYTNSYPNFGKMENVLINADNKGFLSKEVIEFLLNEETEYEMAELLNSFLNDKNDINNNIDENNQLNLS